MAAAEAGQHRCRLPATVVRLGVPVHYIVFVAPRQDRQRRKLHLMRGIRSGDQEARRNGRLIAPRATEALRCCILECEGMDVHSDQLIAWVGRHILPHERQVRAWLRSAFPAADVDDVVQETYCRLAGLDAFDHVSDPRSYFFRTARNVVLEQIRRDRVVRIEAASGLAELDQAPDPARSPEEIVADRYMLSRIERLIDALPDRARQIFRLRKIEGIAQRDIAAQLRVSETVIENDVARGLRRILDQLTDEEKAELPIRRARSGARRSVRRDTGGWR